MFKLLLTLFVTGLWAQINLDTLSAGGLAQIPLTNQFPHRGADVKFGVDTAGFAYIFGGCTYGGWAEGTHSADVFRINIATGHTDRLYDNSASNPYYPAGCQSFTAYDPGRNCMWFGNGQNPLRCGIFKFQCPDGPITKYSDTLLGGGCWGSAVAPYAVFDTAHDFLIGLGPYGLSVFHISSREKFHVSYPFGTINSYEIPNCWDGKRGLLAVTLAQASWDPTYNAQHPAGNLRDMWFFNPADTSWSSRTPSNIPPIYRCEMTYDAVNDKYIYFGSGYSFWFEGESCETQIWAYDYDANAWERIGRNGRVYNDAAPASSTWPATRMKGAFGYSEKYNVCLNWGGFVYGSWGGYDTFPQLDISTLDSCSDLNIQPLWFFRYGGGGTGAEAAVSPDVRRLAASPNPFNPCTNIELPGVSFGPGALSLRILSLNGRVVRDLSREASAAARGKRRQVSWDGRDNGGMTAHSGVYLCVMRNGTVKKTVKLILAR